MSVDAERKGGAGAGGIVVRACGLADRPSIERLGHPRHVCEILCPSLPRRIAWRLLGTRAVSVLAEDRVAGTVVGAAQFVRSRRSRDTWMFGHWRVTVARRRQGIGRRLLEEATHLLPEVGRLYSYVEWDNHVSIAAHERLGFEAGRTLWGKAPLGGLSTVGPANPAVRLEPAGARDWAALFAIYARAMGSLWMRLFPGLGPPNFLGGTTGRPRAGALAVVRALQSAGRGAFTVRAGTAATDRSAAGFVLWDGTTVTLFAEPEACDAALLARVALQIVAQGARRDDGIELRGLPHSLGGRLGPVVFQVLMGMPDVKTQWRR